MSTEWQSETADWVRTGANLFANLVGKCTEADLASASLLPGWNRSHVVAHVSANAQAIGRLLHWARTGQETAMYSSMEDRDREIAAGAQLPLVELASWYAESDEALQQAFATLPQESWAQRVVTAQGREVPASETLWMRSREVLIHAVDMDMGVGFGNLPEGFLVRLAGEAAARHSANPAAEQAIAITTEDGHRSWMIEGEGDAIAVTGSIGDIAAWLVGRGSGHAPCADGSPAPSLPKWL